MELHQQNKCATQHPSQFFPFSFSFLGFILLCIIMYYYYTYCILLDFFVTKWHFV